MKQLLRMAVVVALALTFSVLPACSSSSTTSSSNGSGSDVPLVRAADAEAMIEDNVGNDDLCVLDVRTPEEYVLGHLENSLNIDYYDDSFRDSLDKLDREKTYIVYCRCGKRGAASVTMMQELGFAHVFNLDGGYLEWEFEQLPIEE